MDKGRGFDVIACWFGLCISTLLLTGVVLDLGGSVSGVSVCSFEVLRAVLVHFMLNLTIY